MEKKRWGLWIVYRLFAMICVVFVTFTITFFLVHTIKGDPFSASIEDLPDDIRQRYIAQYGYDKPIIEQYIVFLKQVIIYGNFGVSLRNHTVTVKEVIKNSMPASITVGLLSLCIGTVIGYLLGVSGSYTKSKFINEVISSISIVGASIPIYIFAPILQRELAVKCGLFPVSGWGAMNNLVLPTICMLPLTIATITKYTKGSIEQVINSDYYIAAKQRGFSEIHIFRKHVFKNSLPPIITVFISNMSAVFTGSFIVEKIFSIPGIGRQFMNAISSRDYTIIIGLNVAFTLIYVIFMWLGDLFLGMSNPHFRNTLS